MSLLCQAYGDPDKRGTAERDIQKLHQKGHSLATYVAELQHLASPFIMFGTNRLDNVVTGLRGKEAKQLVECIMSIPFKVII